MRVAPVFLVIGTLQVASASLILVGPTDLNGTGLGAVNTVLTIQSPANTTVATGCVGYIGSDDSFATAVCGFADSNVKQGASQTKTIAVSDTAASGAADLRVVYNSSQPGGGAVTVNNLDLRIYSSTGTLLFTSDRSRRFPSQLRKRVRARRVLFSPWMRSRQLRRRLLWSL